MTRLCNTLLAGVVATGIFSAILITPASAKEDTHHKTTAPTHGKTTAPAHGKTATRPVPHVQVRPEHAVTHTAPRTVTRSHTERTTRVTHATIARDTAIRLRDESTDRLRTIARSRPEMHVTVQRVSSLHEITARHATLTNVTFLTGTVVRRDRDDVILRTTSGRVIPIVTRTIVLNQTAFVPGTTVVIPAQFTNGAFTFVPAFTTADEAETAAMPVVAPCALNDGDADDSGVTGTFAPIGACQHNDGDQDDGFAPPALPSGFLTTAPAAFSNTYMPVVAAGFVVAQSGSDVVVMTPNFTPVVVNASAAMSSGAVSGPLTVGRFVTIEGFDVGNSLVATAIR